MAAAKDRIVAAQRARGDHRSFALFGRIAGLGFLRSAAILAHPTSEGVSGSTAWGADIVMTHDRQHPIAIMGLPLNSLTENQAVDALERLIESGGMHQVCATNVDAWLAALSDAHLHRIVAGSSLVLPDGMPLVRASWLLGCPLAGRVSVADLVKRLAELSARKGYGIFLLGAKPGVAQRVSRLLEREYPGVRIVGAYTPAEENLIEMDHGEILSQIHAARPDILLVAFGNPKQEKWIWMHRKRLGVPLALGVGESFDVLVNDNRRAPRWMQRCGLEWALRLVQEPMRVGPRYARNFVGLCRRLPVGLLAAWCQRPYLGESRLSTTATSHAMHVNIFGRLGAETAAALEAATAASIAKGLTMVVHLHDMQQVTAAGCGVLLEMRRRLLEAGLSVRLTGLSLRTRFVLHAWGLERLFDEWESALLRRRPNVPRPKGPIGIALHGEQEVFPARTRFRA
jgi:N-acetylglucosaminyldiphosphoundecaprenol N-acetyl-beta-D-mannosaminyltransferase